MMVNRLINVSKTFFLFQSLEWRADQNIDSILEENWDDLKSVFPYSINTTDRSGFNGFFLVMYFDFGQWDVAKLISEQPSGKERFERFLFAMWEEVEQRLREIQSEGQNVTQSVVIVNVGNFSLEKQGCIQCKFLAVTNLQMFFVVILIEMLIFLNICHYL